MDVYCFVIFLIVENSYRHINNIYYNTHHSYIIKSHFFDKKIKQGLFSP